MAAALFSTIDYTAAVTSLFPRGRAWPMSPGTVQYAVAGALASGLNRLDARAQTLLVDAFPATTFELLPEWEAALGLPDPCDGEDQTVAQRQAHVLSRFVSSGGQSVLYFLGIFAGLGYADASIIQYAPFRGDVDHGDDIFYDGGAWAFHWTVDLPDLSVFYFEGDVGAGDDFMFSVSDNAVICVTEALAPAHTTVDFVTS